MQQGSLIGQEQAVALVEAIDDPIIKSLVEAQVSTAVKLVWDGYYPCSDFDMVFMVRCAIAFAQRRQAIRMLLDGQEPEGIPD